MQLSIQGFCNVQKRMQTSADKAGDEEIVNCHIGVKSVRVHREVAEELGGVPIGTTVPFFNEVGIPRVPCSFLFPNRELLVTGKIEHRKKGGGRISKLELIEARMVNITFSLDAPEEGNCTYLMSCKLVWKAAGDEIEGVRPILNKKDCSIKLDVKEPPKEKPVDEKQQQLALDRKRVASGESADEAKTPQDEDAMLAGAKEFVERTGRATVSSVQTQFKIGYNRAARLLEALEVLGVVGPLQPNGGRNVLTRFKPQRGGLAELEREAQEKARKHPRRDPPPRSRR